MTIKKKLLAIFPQLPLPEFAGDRQKVNNLIRILSRHFDLNVVIICRYEPTAEDHSFMGDHCFQYRIFTLTKWQIFQNIFRGIFQGEALQVAFFYDKKIQRYIDEQVLGCDAIFCNLVRVAKYALNINKPKVIDIVDSLSINYKRSLDKVESNLWKLIYRYEYKRLNKFEAKVISNFDVSYMVNYHEQQKWQQRLPGKKIVWLPQGIKEELFDYTGIDKKYADGILFIGKMDYQPNIDAVSWFLKNVWKKVDTAIHFYIIGVNPPPMLIQLAGNDKRVEFMGYMKDPYLIMNSCRAVISPMQTGGGVQNKKLEGMAMGKINITTTLGASSINFAKSGEHFLVADAPSEMAKQINDIFHHPDRYQTIKQKAKALASSVYTWSNFENEMIRHIPAE